MICLTKENEFSLKNIECLDIELCVFCGQAFRWRKTDENVFHGIVKEKSVDIEVKENEIIFKNCTEEDFENIWKPYFDTQRNYKEICEKISTDSHIKKAVESYYGIRILRQEPWEALCSFIISQNNNIPRISGIIERFCELYGSKNSAGDYTFPCYKSLFGITAEDLAPIKAGFRGKYIADAVNKLNSGEISLEKIYEMPIEEARQELMKIKGVGPKVAECTLLYGFGKLEAFPVDVWVKRIMEELYENGLPECTKGVEGIAQQYLFHWRRNLKDGEK